MAVGMNWDQFVDAVRTMRIHQKNYRLTKNKDYIVSAREAELKVDFMLKSLEPEEDE